MVRAHFKESIEVGNINNGDFKRWTREAEFSGEASEVAFLIKSASEHFQLPGVKPKSLISGNGVLDEIFPYLLKDKY